MYKTYVMHYTPLESRRKFIEENLCKAGITNAEYITEFDREKLTDEILSKHYNQDPEFHKKVCEISMREGEQYKYEKMRMPSISLNMKHIAAFEKFIKEDVEFALFLEDDCRFKDDTIGVEEVIEHAPQNWDVMVLGGAFDHGICSYEGFMRYEDVTYLKAVHPSTNTTSSILYNKKSVSKIMDHLNSFCVPIDWQLNYAFSEAKLNVYHTQPYLCTQGDFGSTSYDE